MMTCDEDHASMERRKGGGGAGVVVWAFVLIVGMLIALGVAQSLNYAHEWQHDHPRPTTSN